MKWFLILILIALAFISYNNASKFGRILNKDARCERLTTGDSSCNGSHTDTAACTFDNALWLCTADTSGTIAPHCDKIKDLPAEK